MEIAKGFTGTDFLKLDLSNSGSDWPQAIAVLRRRINDRFIEPADKLIELENLIPAYDKKYGFAVLALDCLLCETIQSFYEGVSNSTGKSKGLFVRFLRERKSFKPYFNTEKEAEDFYINFRCSLLHQAQASGITKIWSVGKMIERQATEIRVNRLAFHEALKDEFDSYLTALAKRDDSQLNENFKKKMIYIANRK